MVYIYIYAFFFELLTIKSFLQGVLPLRNFFLLTYLLLDVSFSLFTSQVSFPRGIYMHVCLNPFLLFLVLEDFFFLEILRF